MNHLAPAAEDRWHLPRHARVIVYDRNDRELVTIYDCGAAQKPPAAQLLGNLVRVDAEATTERTTTGYAVTLEERALLERQGEEHYVIRSADQNARDEYQSV